MSISSVAVQRWEEWQLRVLVLCSLVLQLLLFFFAVRRKHVISRWSIRSFIWLMYLGSDSIAIYALAALFSRQQKQDYSTGANNRSILELLWAPILLMHLGGQDCITAYDIEDNELWKRHVFTAVSQITVAIYIFWKSWPTGGDPMLLHAWIVVFISGILKCLDKPWALKGASINSLVSSSDPVQTMTISTLEDYVREAKTIVGPNIEPPQVVLQANPSPYSHQPSLRPVVPMGNRHPSLPFVDPASLKPFVPMGIRRPSQLFVDLASPYDDRIVTLRSFWVLIDKRKAYASLQLGIYATFDLLYTKIKMTANICSLETNHQPRNVGWLPILATCIRLFSCLLPFIAVGLLQKSDTKSYDQKDVTVTYVLFILTAALEFFSFLMNTIGACTQVVNVKIFTDMERLLGAGMQLVAQYSLVGFFARNKIHGTKMCIVSSFGCKDLLDQLWCMKPCDSSAQITQLVVTYVKKVWTKIHDATGYRKFNDHRGQWTLGALSQQQQQKLGWSLRRPFDESVLLWHIATDVCFYRRSSSSSSSSSSSPHQRCAPEHDGNAWCEASLRHKTAVRCKQISQYMIYLLFVNPEMLLSGTRKNLFTTANTELEKIVKRQNIMSTNESEIINELFTLQQDSPSQLPQENKNFFPDAMKLARALHSLSDEKKMWEVMEGVWVEMLCYSASRCRGYLHAKSLAAGGEFLTYVWLLLSHMGMETLPERLQGADMELTSVEPNTGAV